MFDQTFVDTDVHTRKPWTIGVSVVFQLGVTAVVLLIPLLHPEMLTLHVDAPMWVPLKLPPKELPRQAMATALPRKASGARVVLNVFSAPTRVPKQINMDVDTPQIPSAMVSGLSSITGISLLPGLSDAIPSYAGTATPAAVIKKPDVPKGPTHISSGVQSAKLVFSPTPVYPSLAKATRTQGLVRLQAVIAPDGTIRNPVATSGPPWLIAAAVEAVRQWRYQPTLLNGQPVEVATEIDVNFTLGR